MKKKSGKINRTKDVTADADMIKRLNPSDSKIRDEFYRELTRTPIPPKELMSSLPLFQDRRNLSRILFMNEIYQKILPVHGNIVEFGVRYGPNLALFSSLRAVYEPLNVNRRIIGFDTFEGFESVHKQKDLARYKAGNYTVPERYEEYLTGILALHERMAPLQNIRRFELVKGDATKTIKPWLKNNPSMLISLAYFDFDIYEPTRVCLEEILPYLNKGAVIAFDEINLPDFPGETVAFREILGGKFRLIHSPFRGAAAYLIFD